MNDIANEVLGLETELTETEMRLDIDALDRIYADDIMVTAPEGVCVNKEAVMEEIRQAAANARIERYEKEDLTIRAFGDIAVSSYRLSIEVTFAGNLLSRLFCITNVWMKRGHFWQIVARHTAKLEPAAAAAGG